MSKLSISLSTRLIAVLVLFLSCTLYAQEEILTFTVAWSPDGVYLASGNVNGHITIQNSRSGAILHTLTGHEREVTSVDWNPVSALLASVSNDGSLRIWNIETGLPDKVIQIVPVDGYRPALGQVSWNFDGTKIAVAHESDTIHIFDVDSGEEIVAYEQFFPNEVTWHPLKNWLASGSANSTIEIYDLHTRQIIQTLADPENRQFSNIMTLDWSPDGTRLAVGRMDGKVRIWDVQTGTMLQTLVPEAQVIVDGVDWHPDGIHLAVISRDNRVTIWDTVTQAKTSFASNFTLSLDVKWSPYGGRLALAGDVKGVDTNTTADIFATSGVEIIIPDASVNQLQQLAANCVKDASVSSSPILTLAPEAVAVLQMTDLTNFIAGIEALPLDAIPPACAADLIAVAEAIIAGE